MLYNLDLHMLYMKYFAIGWYGHLGNYYEDIRMMVDLSYNNTLLHYDENDLMDKTMVRNDHDKRNLVIYIVNNMC